MNNVEKARSVGILDDLLENFTPQGINSMTPKEILNAWLEWEGIIGYTTSINRIIETFYKSNDNGSN